MKITYYVAPRYLNNECFNKNSPSNRDDCLAPSIAFREACAKSGHTVNTQDITPLSEAEIILCMDTIPRDIANYNVPKILEVREIETVRKANWDLKVHKKFDRILVWRKDIAKKDDKYVHYLAPYPFGNIRVWPVKRDGFCCMIAMNKASFDRRELYGERRKVIRWFENNHPTDFDLYGKYWDQGRSFPFPLSAFRRSRIISHTVFPKYSSYRGEIAKKCEVLRKYNFSICFENARDISCNISEKIFDCFVSGCIPVYWGAPDILEYIPANCFIDYRSFNQPEELFRFMKGLAIDKIEEYRENIRTFLLGDGIHPFSIEQYSSIILETIKSVSLN